MDVARASCQRGARMKRQEVMTGSSWAATAWFALGLATVGCTEVPVTASTTTIQPNKAEPQSPDIVLIVTDDQRWDTLGEMPGLRRTVRAHGMTFREAFVVNPLCCPSRASILTGAYSHTTGVYTNFPPDGGVAAFDDRSTLATWLDDAGYRTAFVGKYLNGYAKPGYVPPGWARWAAFLRGPSPYFDYAMSVDGELREFGSAAADYSTDVLAGIAERFIRGTPSGDPLFLFLAPSAPHHPQTPAPRYAWTEPIIPFSPGPNVPERDVSDKPAYIRALGSQDRHSEQEWNAKAVALKAVDDLVVRTVRALRDRGNLRNTLLVFMSDNGLAVGEHRWSYKLTPYEESIRIPLVVRYDPLTRGTSTNALAVNIDLAPTIAEIVGVETPGAEGRSLVPLLGGDVSAIRTGFLIEHLQFRRGPHRADPPTYCALRTVDRLFVHYDTGEEELYDLRRDPYQLRNLATDPARRAELDELRARTKLRCRPPPPRFSWTSP